MFKRILLATDGSPVVERQILYAEHLAWSSRFSTHCPAMVVLALA